VKLRRNVLGTLSDVRSMVDVKDEHGSEAPGATARLNREKRADHWACIADKVLVAIQ
jgi:hypothetical protein